MSAYVIVEFTVKDPETYKEKYAPIAGQTAKNHGGEPRRRKLGSPARRWLAHVRSTRALCRP
jgi:uncharacterized protein (DUF1330 family)